jgi:ParB-like chromosome segregation protein Spo0J
MVEAREIEIGRLRPHGENANVMSKAAMAALERNIRRSGRYPALIVRPITERGGNARAPCYELLDGHHRLEVLRRVGQERARCEVWTGVDDDEARLLLATLNRLEGVDDPVKRGRLLGRLLERRERTDVKELLPDSVERLERLLALGSEDRPSGRLLDRTGGGNETEGGGGAATRRGLTVFVPAEAYVRVRRRLREIDDDPGAALCRVLGVDGSRNRGEAE